MYWPEHAADPLFSVVEVHVPFEQLSVMVRLHGVAATNGHARSRARANSLRERGMGRGLLKWIDILTNRLQQPGKIVRTHLLRTHLGIEIHAAQPSQHAIPSQIVPSSQV